MSEIRIPTPPSASSPAARSVMRGNQARDTKPEIAIRSALHQQGLRFRKHAVPLEGLRCRADIVFPRERIAIFVDGCFWHGCPSHGLRPQTNQAYWDAKIARNVQRDSRNNNVLSEAGWKVVRVWEHEPVETAVVRIETLVRRLRRSRDQVEVRPA